MNTPDTLGIALDLHAKEYTPVAMVLGTKTPAEKWSHLYDQGRTIESIRARSWEGFGISIICREPVVVIDVDDENDLDRVLEKCGAKGSPICRTPSGGFHVHGKLRKGVERSRKIRVHGKPCDLLVGRSLSILHSPGYEWLGNGLPHISELPLLRVGWTYERERKRIQSVIAPEVCAASDIIRRGQPYIDRFERRAVSDQGGHTSMFVNCLKICGFVKKLNGGKEEAWQLILYCNATKCDPPWDVTDSRDVAALRHKLDDAWEKDR